MRVLMGADHDNRGIAPQKEGFGGGRRAVEKGELLRKIEDWIVGCRDENLWAEGRGRMMKGHQKKRRVLWGIGDRRGR
jgi:hypothetical protein